MANTKADDLVELAKLARRQGRVSEAVDLYRQASEVYEDGGDFMRGAHAARHQAELLIQAGQAREATVVIAAVVLFYSQRHIEGIVPRLEIANTMRVSALAHEQEGFYKNAREHWQLASELYEAEGINEGVAEARRHLSVLPDA